MCRKAQVTVFLLLGIVLLVIFGFLFYVSNNVAKVKTEENLEKVVNQIITTSAIKYYATLAFEEAVREATLTIGNQGGAIFCDQYLKEDGATQDGEYIRNYNVDCTDKTATLTKSTSFLSPYFEDKTFDIVYAILSPPYSADYPIIISPSEGQAPLTPSLKLNIGEFNLNHLCQSNGPNKVTSYYTGKIPCNLIGRERGVDLNYGTEHSMQKQLSDYIAYLIGKKVKISEIIQDSNYDIQQGDISVNTTFGDFKTDFELSYPLIISVKGKPPVVKTLSFQTTLPVAFKEVGSFALMLMTKEASSIFFEISEPSQTNNPDLKWRNGMLVSVDNTKPLYNLIMIEDTKSTILGKNFGFNFLIQNRPPVLNTIHKHGLSLNTDVDIAVKIGESIEIKPPPGQPFAMDPDEEDTLSLSFKYFGWKQDYTKNFDLSKCKHRGGSLDCFNLNELKLESAFNTEELVEGQWIIQTSIPDKGTAISSTSLNDIGLHTTTITVSDPAGTSDSQDVKIFVGECKEDADCGSYNIYYCDGNELKKQKWGCYPIVDSYGFCYHNPAWIPDDPIDSCTGKENNMCVNGFDTCQNKCTNEWDDDSDGLTDCKFGIEDPECACP